jgi:hypothetical protein
MQFIIDKQARRAYLFADTEMEELTLRQIFAHVNGQLPNTTKLVPAQKEKGYQPMRAYIEFADSSIYRRS